MSLRSVHLPGTLLTRIKLSRQTKRATVRERDCTFLVAVFVTPPPKIIRNMETKVLFSGFKNENLPEGYVRPESERPRLSEVYECENIPVINLASDNRAETVQQVGDACKSYGFFQVINHGVSTEAVEKILGTATEFFSLPVGEKMKLYSDDPLKTMRLSTSFTVNKEKVHNWRDYLRLHCYPLDKYVPEWPSNPSSFKSALFCLVMISLIPHGGFILFDEPANLKPDFLQTCYNRLSREYGNIPIVLCSNKADVNHVLMMGDKNITLPHSEISANNDHNLEAPFLYLAKKLTENNELLSVRPQQPVVTAPPMQMDMTAAQHGPESAPAAAQPGPVEDNNGCCSACLKPLVEYLKCCYYLVSIWDTCMKWLEDA